MGKHQVQETLSMEKYQKDLEKAKEKRAGAREAMRKKLDKQGYIFQKDQEKLEKRFNKKKKEGTLTDKDILEAFINLELTPMVHGATIQIRSGAEKAILDATVEGKTDGLKARNALPGSFSMTAGVMALIEPETKKLQRRLKEFYKDLYGKKETI